MNLEWEPSNDNEWRWNQPAGYSGVGLSIIFDDDTKEFVLNEEYSDEQMDVSRHDSFREADTAACHQVLQLARDAQAQAAKNLAIAMEIQSMLDEQSAPEPAE